MKGVNRFINLVMGGVTAISSALVLGSTKKIDDSLKTAESITRYILSQNEKFEGGVVEARYLKGLNESEDYILAVGTKGGFAIFDTEMELIEFSETGKSPYEGIENNQSYYAGPSNYYRKQGNNALHLHTKQALKQEDKKTVAEKIKNKIKNGKEERRKEKGERQKNITTEENQKDETVYADPGPTGGDTIEINEYTVVERSFIPNSQFFMNRPQHGTNLGKTCVSVAAQLFLAYHNWANDGRIIRTNAFLLERDFENYQQPYHPNVIGTSSTVADDGVTTFYEQLLAYIDPLHDSANTFDAVYGINTYLKNHVEQNVADLITVSAYYTAKNARPAIREEIVSGNPAMVGITYYESQDDGTYASDGHEIVVYGTQTFNVNGEEIDGFIAHFGWKEYPAALWVNSSWVEDAITLHTTHEHMDRFFEGNNHVLRCIECERITCTDEHTFTEVKKIESNDGLADKRDDFHVIVCSCGYRQASNHSFLYSPYSISMHEKQCKLCEYETLEEHYYRWGNECFICGDSA